MPTVKVAPFNRIEGHLDIECTTAPAGPGQKITDAENKGVMFRGFENILINRDPRDAPIIAQRV
jgi:hydrogenase large subunit